MVAFSFSEPAASIRYALSHCPQAGDRVDIVLDLYRGSVLALTKTIARVSDAELGPVTLKCRSYLERRGAEPLASAPPTPITRARIAKKPKAASAPVAAFDWLFAG